MNKKYNSYDHLSKLKLNNDIRIIKIKKGCSRKICYNLLCVNNIICKNSNLFL